MTPENAETIGNLSDTLDNILHTAKLPLPASFHLVQLVAHIEVARDKLREVYKSETGENPWDHSYLNDDDLPY